MESPSLNTPQRFEWLSRRRIITLLIMVPFIALTAWYVIKTEFSDDDPNPGKESTAEESHEDPSPGEEEFRPSYPKAAREQSEAGMLAALKYQNDLLHYAQRTGDTGALGQVWDFNYCGHCIDIRENLDRFLVDGMRIRGGEYTITNVHIIGSVQADDGGAPYNIVEETSTTTASELVDAKGNVVDRDEAHGEATQIIKLTYRGGRWWIHSISDKEQP